MGFQHRVVVTGANGWFGAHALAMCREQGFEVLPITRQAQQLDVIGSAESLVSMKYDLAVIAEFAPTLVVDTAFVTRERIADFGMARYIAENRALTARLLELANLRTVQRVISFSSGAAVFPVDASSQPMHVNPYGYLKREAELALEELTSRRVITVVDTRVWSVSGTHVKKPAAFAFSDFVSQAARSGTIHVTAPHLVFRRYVSIRDVLQLSIFGDFPVGYNVFDTGGELIELRGLARRVADAIAGDVKIEAAAAEGTADRYYSDPAEWNLLLARNRLTARTIDDQIQDILREG